MSKRARYSRDVVALGTILLSGAFIVACQGGPGDLGGSQLELYQPPPGDSRYQEALDDGPPVTDGLGNPIDGGGGDPIGTGGSDSSGKGGSDSSGKGGSNGGGNGTCAQVIAAIKACPELELPDSVIPQVTASCEPYSGACKACIAALDCEDLAVVVGEQGPEGSKCSSTCTDGGEGGTGGTGGGGPGKGGTGGTGGSSSGKGGTGGTGGTGGSGGTGGTGGGSSSGDCVDDLVAKGVECEVAISESQASQLCSSAPTCAACLTSVPCDSPEDVCSAACEQ